MVVAQLTSSSFIGGTERQMLGLALSLPASCRSIFVLFRDQHRSELFRNQLLGHGLETAVLARDTPFLPTMVGELAGRLEALGASVLCCHGYKSDIVGLLAARRVGVPVISVSHGWTSANLKVRIYEALGRACLRWMDRVVCVSEAQAVKVRRTGVRPDRVTVIHDAVRVERFDRPDSSDRGSLVAMFPQPVNRIVGSAGRLSPEKGFGVLVEAAAIVTRSDPGVGFVHFGDGPLRVTLAQRVAALGLERRFLLAGFREDLDRFLPHWDVSVLPSFTEGLPNVVLESFAAGVPVVATAVGGTPEAVADGIDGFLVPPGDPVVLARRILDVLKLDEVRRTMGQRGRERIRAQFAFETQALRYQELFDELAAWRPANAWVPHSAPNPQPTSWR
jgi:glycosyltransferase involved in cell wall biosynthesis